MSVRSSVWWPARKTRRVYEIILTVKCGVGFIRAFCNTGRNENSVIDNSDGGEGTLLNEC